MYEKLIEKMRCCSDQYRCGDCRFVEDCAGEEYLLDEAADAIEKLQGKVKELHYLACDVNKSEIMAQLEIGNLENFLHTFREYANKIADIQLPEPLEEE